MFWLVGGIIDKTLLISLFARGEIKPEIIEKSIKPLQLEKEDLEAKSKDLSDINEILEVRVEDFSNDAIKQQLERFEKIVTDDNLNELRNLVRDFIYKIELFPKEDPNTKKWKRRLSIQGYIRALTMILLVSPIPM